MKKVLSIILILVLAISIANISFAASDNLLEIKVSSKNLSPGDTVTLTVVVKETNLVDGIYCIDAQIEYDTNVFEKMKEIDLSGSSVEFQEQNNRFSVECQGAKANDEVCKIKLKVKSNPKSGNTTVKLKNLKTSDDRNDLDMDDAEYTFTVSTSGGNNSGDDDNENDGNGGNGGNNSGDNKGDGSGSGSGDGSGSGSGSGSGDGSGSGSGNGSGNGSGDGSGSGSGNGSGNGSGSGSGSGSGNGSGSGSGNGSGSGSGNGSGSGSGNGSGSGSGNGSGSTSGGSQSGAGSGSSINKLPAAGKTVMSVALISGLIAVGTFGLLYNKYRKILK